jgi:hypothetical protein
MDVSAISVESCRPPLQRSISTQKQKTHRPGLLVVGPNHCQPANFRRRDYPLHLALGQAQQAIWQRQYAPVFAEWIGDCIVLRLPERQIRRKAKFRWKNALTQA